jgi:minor histocompatibility antigen H13
VPSLLALPLSLLPPLIYLSHTASYATSPTPPVIFNILTLSLAHTALSTLKLDRFMTGAVLLSGLFLYDVFWVFGSEKVVGSNVVGLPL